MKFRSYFTEFREVFEFHRDKHGTIHLRDLGQALRSAGLILSEADVAKIIEEVETEECESIDFPAFLTLVALSMNYSHSEEDILDAVSVLDYFGTGFVSTAGLRRILVTLGEKLTAEQADEMISEAEESENSEGQIKYRGELGISVSSICST
jgi:calmodulin